MAFEKPRYHRWAEACIWDYRAWLDKQAERQDAVGFAARSYDFNGEERKAPDDKKWMTRTLARAEYYREAKDILARMIRPAPDEAKSLLLAIREKPDEKNLSAFADLLEECGGPTPVELHKFPRWTKQARMFGPNTAWHDYDHWGRTVIFGLEVFVSEPYRSPQEALEMAAKRTFGDGIPFFATRGDWFHRGVVRVGAFPFNLNPVVD